MLLARRARQPYPNPTPSHTLRAARQAYAVALVDGFHVAAAHGQALGGARPAAPVGPPVAPAADAGDPASPGQPPAAPAPAPALLAAAARTVAAFLTRHVADGAVAGPDLRAALLASLGRLLRQGRYLAVFEASADARALLVRPLAPCAAAGPPDGPARVADCGLPCVPCPSTDTQLTKGVLAGQFCRVESFDVRRQASSGTTVQVLNGQRVGDICMDLGATCAQVPGLLDVFNGRDWLAAVRILARLLRPEAPGAPAAPPPHGALAPAAAGWDGRAADAAWCGSGAGGSAAGSRTGSRLGEDGLQGHAGETLGSAEAQGDEAGPPGAARAAPGEGFVGSAGGGAGSAGADERATAAAAGAAGQQPAARPADGGLLGPAGCGGSRVFQGAFARALAGSAPLRRAALDRLFLMLNWALTELAAASQARTLRAHARGAADVLPRDPPSSPPHPFRPAHVSCTQDLIGGCMGASDAAHASLSAALAMRAAGCCFVLR